MGWVRLGLCIPNHNYGFFATKKLFHSIKPIFDIFALLVISFSTVCKQVFPTFYSFA
jgi:hypothetical protein